MKKSTEEQVKEAVSSFFESRKMIENVLFEKEQHTLKDFDPSSKEIDASVWNDFGIWFLNNQMYSDAAKIYERLLHLNIEIEKAKGIKLHKGLPFYNLGIAQIEQGNFDMGVQNVLRAYDEDIESHGETEARKMLAFKLKEGLSDFISNVIDKEYLPRFEKIVGEALNSADLMMNMEEAEKLLLVKIINSEKSLSFHEDIYTKVVFFDNLKNLAMLIEYNIRRRTKRKIHLSQVDQVFPSEAWIAEFSANKRLTSYSGVKDFEDKLKKIAGLSPLTDVSSNFFLRSFLTATLIRNFVAHYLDEKIDVLSGDTKYAEVFEQILFALLYTLSKKI